MAFMASGLSLSSAVFGEILSLLLSQPAIIVYPGLHSRYKKRFFSCFYSYSRGREAVNHP
jgi:hypothetical protein